MYTGKTLVSWMGIEDQREGFFLVLILGKKTAGIVLNHNFGKQKVEMGRDFLLSNHI